MSDIPSLLRFRAPAELRGKVRDALRRGATAHRVAPASSLPWWRGLAVAACLALATIGIRSVSRSGVEPANELLEAHVRSLMLDHLTDVASSDHHTVKPWFAGKLDFSPPVVDLAPDSFPLLGARIDRVGGRDVAALVYGRRRHVVNLFVWPASGGPRAARATTSRGYHLLAWSAGGLELVAVSDLNAEELGRLPQLLARADTTVR